ncbi:MAG TPA: di-heme oxidoredictase family protein, partial [bacterium]
MGAISNRFFHRLLILAAATAILSACTGDSGSSEDSAASCPAPSATMGHAGPTPGTPTAASGGDTTIDSASSHAFAQPAPNLSVGAETTEHIAGDAAFDASFVPAGNEINPGLGPVFNNKACSLCHLNDGRGRPPLAGEQMDQMLMRISIGNDATTGPIAAPGFGGQIQNHAITGVQPEALVQVSYAAVDCNYPDGAKRTLRSPSYRLTQPYTALPSTYFLSPRAPPAVFGRGLLEAIAEATLQGLVTSQASGGVVSGKINYVKNPLNAATEVGRFGLKANVSTLLVQSAGAYLQDMGITSDYLPTESSAGQSQADGLSDDPEIDAATVDATAFYTQTLAVPERRNLSDATALAGEALFAQIGCNLCHVAPLTTGTLSGVPAVSNQTIYAYTDLLLHDMGDGLADGISQGQATQREFRTAPLWG